MDPVLNDLKPSRHRTTTPLLTTLFAALSVPE